MNRDNICSSFTDGSKVDKNAAVGSSVYCSLLSLEQKFTYNKQMSVFSAECAAIAGTLKKISDKNIKNTAIFSDSLSTLQCLASKRITVKTNPFIFYCKQIYHQIISKNPAHAPRFFWIPAHVGIQGNEAADKLAKLATLNDVTDSPSVPFTDFKEYFNLQAAGITTLVVFESWQHH